MGRGRFSKVVSVLVTGIIAMSGLPSAVLADVINAPTYYSVQSGLEYEVTTNVTSSWISHTSVDFVVSNTGSETIHNWYLTFNTPYSIDNIWNGALYETDGNGTYTITSNGWNQDIHTGESITVGITFSSDTEENLSVDPEWYLLNTQAAVIDASQYTLEYTEYSAWETGFTGQLTLTPQVDCQHWEFSFGSNREITAVSSAVLISEGENNYAITHDENNMRLFAGNAYNFGIQGVNTEDLLDMSNVELTVVDLAYHLTDDEDANGVPDYLEFIGGGSIIDPTPTPTPVPVDVPTETPMIDPTVYPTSFLTPEPTITATPTNEPTTIPTGIPTAMVTPIEEPTPTPITDYESDQDLDGLPDYIEDQIGTNPLKVDTDDDGLCDYLELISSYDPTTPDTDGNGVMDGLEDCDCDGLTNVYELSLGTDFLSEDTDCDRLLDGDEVNIYGTDPLVVDSDGDGVNDGSEIAIGKNPTNRIDGSMKINQTLTRAFNNADSPAITMVTVTADLSGEIESVLEIRDYYNIDVYSTDVYGRVGSPVNIECNELFDSATVIIHYDEAQLGESLEENLGILWFDEENGIYIMQEQAIVDSINNTVTLELEHFSTYVLVDKQMWNNPILPDYGWNLHYKIYGFPANGSTNVSSHEEQEWANYQESVHNPNLIRLGTFFSGLMYYPWGWSGEYRFDWIIMDNTDVDEDNVPDFMETQGVLGSNHRIYYSSTDTNMSDGDSWSDAHELGTVFILIATTSNEVQVYTKNESGEIRPYTGYTYFDDLAELVNINQAIVLSFGTDPSNSDTDGDYYIDSSDSHPLFPDVIFYGLGNEEVDINNLEANNYIHVYRESNDYYGGNQGWYGNSIFDPVSLTTLHNIQSSGCGIIATNDVRLYLQNGYTTYNEETYQTELFDTYNSFAPYYWGGLVDSYGIPTGLHSFAAPPDPIRVTWALESYGFDCHTNRVMPWNHDSLLSLIINSVENDHPVILCEIDPSWLANFEFSRRVAMGLDPDHNNPANIGFVIYNTDLHMAANGACLEATTYSSSAMSNHYVTVTGVLVDNSSGEAWLRVQTWGHARYVNYNEFVNYQSPYYPVSTAMGSIIVLE